MGSRTLQRVFPVFLFKVREIMAGASANASPHTQKLRRGVTHIWGNPRGQPNRSAMGGPHPRGTALVITVSPRPGKYEDSEAAMARLSSS